MAQRGSHTDEPLSYAEAGVDIAAGEKAVEMIKAHVRSTFRPEVVGDIGGFGGLFEFEPKRFDHPLLDQSWIVCEGCGISGTLEATPHNNVHNIVGGLMGSSQSALDPIFMMHHCNIDRIWAVWNVNNQNSNDPFWTGMTFQNNFYNPDGSFYSPKVSDLYTPETLGYTYGLAPPPAAAVAPAIVALGDKITTLYATPDVSSAAGISTFTAPNAQQAAATANKPLEIAVEVDRERTIAHRSSFMAVDNSKAANSQRER
jgi:hypothetical protein